MVEKQQPEYDIVKRAGHLEKHPEDATHDDVKRMASRILNDQRNAPEKNRTIPKPEATAARVAQVKKRVALSEATRAKKSRAAEVIETLEANKKNIPELKLSDEANGKRKR